MVLATSSPLLAAPCAGFTDVDDSSPFCVNVEWMRNRGPPGSTPTLYDPNSPVTRLQMAAFMHRLGLQNAFLQGGSEFGAPAVFGTIDAHPLDIRANNARVMRYEPNAISPNVIGAVRRTMSRQGCAARPLAAVACRAAAPTRTSVAKRRTR